jgi:hypothetical protein
MSDIGLLAHSCARSPTTFSLEQSTPFPMSILHPSSPHRAPPSAQPIPAPHLGSSPLGGLDIVLEQDTLSRFRCSHNHILMLNANVRLVLN